MSIAWVGLPDVWKSWIKGHTKHVQNNSVSWWEEFCMDMLGLLLGADELCKCTGLISRCRIDVYRHSTCWHIAQLVQTGHVFQSGKSWGKTPKLQHLEFQMLAGVHDLYHLLCLVSWKLSSGTISKEEKKKKEKWGGSWGRAHLSNFMFS